MMTRSQNVPPNIVEAINRLVRTARQMLPEIGREPTAEELADRVAMPLDKVRKILEIARKPIRLASPILDAEDGKS